MDDESRRIDWAATARVGRPIVRTYRAERNQTVVNLLDAGRVMAGRVDEVPRLEHAMDAVMTSGDETRTRQVEMTITFDGDETATIVVNGEEREIDLSAREGRSPLRPRGGGTGG